MDVRERTWIDRPSDEVLAIVTDPTSWPWWSRLVAPDAGSAGGPGLTEVGAEAAGLLGPPQRRQPVTWRVVRRVRDIVDLEAVAAGVPVATVQVSVSPWDGGAALEIGYEDRRRRGQWWSSRQLRRDLEALARLVEVGPDHPAPRPVGYARRGRAAATT